MDSKYRITIPKPCHEDWNTMTPDTTGRFCSSCVKSVVDFTKMNASEIQDYFTKNKGESVCGRFKNDQVNTFNLEIPQSALYRKMPFHNAFVLALFIVMGSTLFSCRNEDNNTLGEVTVVNDTIRQDSVVPGHVTLGMALPEREDSLLSRPTPKIDKVKFVKEEQLKGKVKLEHTKSKEDFVGTTTLGNAMPEIMIDSTKIEKK